MILLCPSDERLCSSTNPLGKALLYSFVKLSKLSGKKFHRNFAEAQVKLVKEGTFVLIRKLKTDKGVLKNQLKMPGLLIPGLLVFI
jgi:hypothetical protein